MHIIWLTTIFDDSAVSNILLQLLPHFKKDITITIVSLESTTHSQSHALKSLVDIKKSYPVSIDHISLECKKTQLFKMIRALNKVIKTHNPNIIHAQLGRAYIAAMFVKNKHKSLIKIATFHNTARHFNPLTYFFLSLFFTRFHAISAVSQYALHSIQHAFDKKKKIPAHTIHNPIISNTNTLSPTNTPIIPKNTYIILVASRLSPGKGHQLCLRMLPILQHKLARENKSMPYMVCWHRTSRTKATHIYYKTYPAKFGTYVRT